MHAHAQRWSAFVGCLLAVGLSAGWVSPGLAAPPGAATILAPSGVIPGVSLAFTWQAVPDATFYYLWVNDATASPKFTAWYPAGQACPAGTATCFVTLTTGFAMGAARWWIQTWNADGYGPFSTPLDFEVSYVPGAWGLTLTGNRFQLAMGGAAVLDRETGLVWERAPATSSIDWPGAFAVCLERTTGNRLGWRLPRAEEIYTLVDQSQASKLPAGHPFTVGTALFWTATTSYVDPTDGLALDLGGGLAPGFVVRRDKTTMQRQWCVRGGHANDH
jgi:hypothetical protein